MVDSKLNQAQASSRISDFIGSRSSQDDLLRTLSQGSTTNTSDNVDLLAGYSDSRRYSGTRTGLSTGRVVRTSTQSSPGSHLGNYQAKLIAYFDRDGDGIVSDQEVFAYVTERRKAGQAISDNIKSVNKNADLIINLSYLADPDKNGIISDSELINAVMALRASSKEEINLAILDLVTASNPNRGEVLKSIIASDLDKTGDISDVEVLTVLLSEGKLGISQEVLYKVLGTNENFSEIKTFLDSLNIDPDGVMSNEEVFNFLMAFRSHGFSINKSDVLGFLNTNPNLNEIENSIEYFDPDANGDISADEFLAGVLSIESGAEELSHSTVLEILSHNSRYQDILEVFSQIDADHDGIYTEDELVQAWLKFKQGELSVDKPTLYMILGTLSQTKGLGLKLELLDANNDNVIENPELIDFVLKTRAKDIVGLSPNTLDAIYKLNPDSTQIKLAINTIDANADGKIDNIETINTILAHRKGELGLTDSLVDTILHHNEKYQEIIDIIDLVDINRDGVFAEEEILNVLIGLRRGVLDLSNPALLNDLINSSPNLLAAVEALDLFDPDKNGFFEEGDYIKALMKIRSNHTLAPSAALMERIDSELEDSSLINEVVDSMDSDADGVISVQELLKNYSKTYISNGVPDLSKKAVLDRVLAITNPDAAEILALRNAIDTNHDGIISDEEAAVAILKIRAGELVDIGKQNLIDLLSDNAHVPEIYSTIEKIDANNDGAIGDSEVFAELIADAKAKLTDRSQVEETVLSLNQKYPELKAMFAALDLNADGIYSDSELVSAWIKARKQESNFNQTDLYSIINTLSSTKNLTSILEKLDVNPDGTIDDTEMLKFLMDLRLNPNPNITSSTLDAIYALNANKDIIESAIDAVDTSHDGKISNRELSTAILAIRRRELAIDSTTFDLIASYNSNRPLIESTIGFIDKDNDGSFDEAEVFSALLTVRKSPTAVVDKNIFNELIDSFGNAAGAIAALNLYDPDGNGTFAETDYIKAQISIRKKQAAKPSASLMQKIDAEVSSSALVNELIAKMDSSGDGVIDNTELVKNYYSSFIINGVADMERKAVLDRILAITNPGAQDILNIRSQFDIDNSGTVSDTEAILGLLKVKKGLIVDLGKSAFSALIPENSNMAEIYDQIEIIDRDDNGRIEDYEVMTMIVKHSISGVAYTGVEEQILALDPLYQAMKTEVASFGIDWTKTGSAMDDQLRALILKARKKEISANYLDLMLAMYKPSLLEEKLIAELFDTNIDGIITNLELIKGMDKYFKGGFEINPLIFEMMLFKVAKYKQAYDLVKAELDAGHALDYSALASQLG